MGLENWLIELESVAESLASRATRLMDRAQKEPQVAPFLRLASEWMTDNENSLRQIIAGIREEM